jgi:hypothetical protein
MLCALSAGFHLASVCAANAADVGAGGAHNPQAAAATRPAYCLGGVLNQAAATSYLTLGDYPAYATAPTDNRRVVCGDRIPPYIVWLGYGNRNGRRGR